MIKIKNKETPYVNSIQIGGERGGEAKIIELEPRPPLKKAVSLVKSLQNLGCDNFSHSNATVTKL